MPDENLTTSTGMQADFSGGALQIGSTKHWIPDLSEISTSRSQSELDWTVFGTLLASGQRIQISLQETAKDFVNHASVLARLYCHAVISRLPDEALQETCESVDNIYEFYSQPLSVTALPPPTIQGRAGLSQLREAPGFQIVEE